MEGSGSSSSGVRRRRRRAVEALAWEQDGIVSRRELYAVGYTRAEVRANVRADRWRRVGRQSICVHRGPLSQRAEHRAAVNEAGPRAYVGYAWKPDSAPGLAARPAPRLGEHTDFVLGVVLGYAPEKLTRLAERGVTENDPRRL